MIQTVSPDEFTLFRKIAHKQIQGKSCVQSTVGLEKEELNSVGEWRYRVKVWKN